MPMMCISKLFSLRPMIFFRSNRFKVARGPASIDHSVSPRADVDAIDGHLVGHRDNVGVRPLVASFAQPFLCVRDDLIPGRLLPGRRVPVVCFGAPTLG